MLTPSTTEIQYYIKKHEQTGLNKSEVGELVKVAELFLKQQNLLSNINRILGIAIAGNGAWETAVRKAAKTLEGNNDL